MAVDLLNTPKEQRGRLLAQLRELAGRMRPETPVSLVLMTGHLQVNTTFSDGARGLSLALEKSFGTRGLNLPADINEKQEVFATISNDIHAIESKTNVDVTRQANRAETTLGEFVELAHWLNAYPGRKHVFWLSAGFPLEGLEPGMAGGVPGLSRTAENRRVATMQEWTLKSLESARVAIDPVDVRGPALERVAGMTTGTILPIARGGRGSTDVINDAQMLARERSEMLDLAHATGGQVYSGSDIARALEMQMASDRSFYTLTYMPADVPWDGKYHAVKVEVDRPGANVEYREGYYARASTASEGLTLKEFTAALRPARPAGTDLLFRAQVTRTAGKVEVTYALDPATLPLEHSSDGKLFADVDCAVAEFDGKGKVLEQAMVRLSGAITEAQRTRLKADSISTRQTIPLKSGAALLVIGVHDHATGKMGSLQVKLDGL